MIMEAMRLSLIEEEERQKKEREKKAKEEAEKAKKGEPSTSAAESPSAQEASTAAASSSSASAPATATGSMPTLTIPASSSTGRGSLDANDERRRSLTPTETSSKSRHRFSASLSRLRGRSPSPPRGAISTAFRNVTSTAAAIGTPSPVSPRSGAQTPQLPASTPPNEPAVTQAPPVVVTPEDGAVERQGTSQSPASSGISANAELSAPVPPPRPMHTESFASSIASVDSAGIDTYEHLESSDEGSGTHERLLDTTPLTTPSAESR
jgi:hypothetical protein